MAQFRCSINGVDLCFDPVNSSCGVSPQGYAVCTCGSHNRQADNVYLHLPTCSLPKNYYEAYLAVFVLLLLLSLAMLLPVARKIRSGALARRLVALAILHHAIMVLFAFALLIQGGYYEAGIVFYALKNIILTYLIHGLLKMMLEPIAIGMSRNYAETDKKLMCLQYFTISCFVIYASVLCAYSRNEVVFNHLALGSVSLNSFLCFCYNIALAKITNQMIQTFDLLNPTPATMDAKERLHMVRRNFIIIACIICTCPLFFAPYVILGSIPFAFAFAAVVDVVVFGLFVPVQLYLMLRQKSKYKTKPETPRGDPSTGNPRGFFATAQKTNEVQAANSGNRLQKRLSSFLLAPEQRAQSPPSSSPPPNPTADSRQMAIV